MVFLVQSTAPSAVPRLPSQCVNQDQLKTERSVMGNLVDELTVLFFLMQMTKVFSSSPRSTLDHKSLASKIAETALENWFSNLPLVADEHSCLSHLICLFLTFRMRHPAAPSPLRFFTVWRVEALFFCGFLILVLHIPRIYSS